MHFYTWIQLCCLLIVYLVKHFKQTALAFPFILMLFIIFRQMILSKIFTEKELQAVSNFNLLLKRIKKKQFKC